MDPIRIACTAIAIVLLATSCIEQQSADSRRVPSTTAAVSSGARAALETSRDQRLRDERAQARQATAFGSTGIGDESFARIPGALDVDDAWERARYLMTVVPVQPEVSSLREFRRKLRRYHGNQQFFDAVNERARPWLYHVIRELASRGMPGEIALLPAVESGYNVSALSVRSAAGLWQILPGTARELDLAQSWWYDARYDALAATTAALDYLSTLQATFNNDWLLAVAAYNCGPGNLRRAIVRAGLKIETASYPAIERYLPTETRGHMARWLVISEVVAMPRLHNVRMKTIPWRSYFATVSASSQVDFKVAARRAGVSESEISMLNLGFTRGMTTPTGPHRLLVPAEHADSFKHELAMLRRPLPTQGRHYRVRRGDTLGLIAEAHGTTVKALMAANRLNSHLIRTGRELMIPGSHNLSADASFGADASFARSGVHIVSPGESLWLIARQYQTTVDSLRDLNRIAPGANMLRPGQELRVRGEG